MMVAMWNITGLFSSTYNTIYDSNFTELTSAVTVGLCPTGYECRTVTNELFCIDLVGIRRCVDVAMTTFMTIKRFNVNHTNCSLPIITTAVAVSKEVVLATKVGYSHLLWNPFTVGTALFVAAGTLLYHYSPSLPGLAQRKAST